MHAKFNVALVLENFELTDDNLDHLFGVLPGALPAEIAGVVTVGAPIEAESVEDAAFELIEVFGKLFPEAIPCRLDQDLVSISDIAGRTDRTRESVRLLVDGKRGPGGFPKPVGTVGDGIRVWPWAAVVGWFTEHLHEDVGEAGVPPEIAAMVDAHLVHSRAAS